MALKAAPVQDNIPTKRGSALEAIKAEEQHDGTRSQSLESSPSWQTQSSITSPASTSNESSSPPGPMTPPTRPVDRTRNRYGDIGRVPLHRRGTSKTYERLEDLLREAGYKETRVFTPECDRNQEAADRDRKADQNRLSNMGAVVDFLANLFPGPGKHARQPSDSEMQHDYSPPRSPLEDRRAVRSPVTPSNLTSSASSLDDPTPRATRQVSESRSYLQHQRHRISAASSRPSEASLYTTSPTLAHPQPSRAGAYLRHMASTTSMPPLRPNSTPVHNRSTTLSMRTKGRHNDDPNGPFQSRRNGDVEQPPLPNTWLETVTRAVLASGPSVQIGGPIHSRKPQTLRGSRSTLSQPATRRSNGKRRNGLTDQTNTLPPPPLLTMIERGRAGMSESEVTRTKVVCRSAPGSRASSLVRRGSERRGRGDKRRRDEEVEKDRLPSLARTQVEGDPWNHGRGRSTAHLSRLTASEIKSFYLSGGGGGYNDGNDSADEGHTSEDDDDGELDLARMLVHPKRQQSIRSLRKHLQGEFSNEAPPRIPSRTPRGASFSGHNYVKSPLSDEDDWGQEWGSGWTRRGGGSAGDDDDDDEAASFARVFGDLNNSSRNGRP